MKIVPFLATLALLSIGVEARASTAAVPRFSDPVALVEWLITNSGRAFHYFDTATTANVFSPGLRDALAASFRQSRRNNEPPCGANGDIILDTQEGGAARNLRLTAERTAPDRVAVAASFDVDGYHRDKRFLTVDLDGAWKVENILNERGASLRRNLACR